MESSAALMSAMLAYGAFGGASLGFTQGQPAGKLFFKIRKTFADAVGVGVAVAVGRERDAAVAAVAAVGRVDGTFGPCC